MVGGVEAGPVALFILLANTVESMVDRPLLALSYDPEVDAAAPPWPFHPPTWRMPTVWSPCRMHGSGLGGGASHRPGWRSADNGTAAIKGCWLGF